MANTRFTLIGKCVVFLVKMPDSMLRTVLKEMEQLRKVRSSANARRGPQRTYRNKNNTKTTQKKKRPTNAQLKARKEFAMRVRRGDFR